MCMVGDEDWWEFFHETHPKARKEHRCGECRRTIEPGEVYWMGTGLMDGNWSTYKTCGQCRAVTRWLEVVCDGWLYDGVQEDLFNHVTGDEQYLRSAPLTRLARWMLADWRDRQGELRPVEAVREVTDRAIAAYHRLEAA